MQKVKTPIIEVKCNNSKPVQSIQIIQIHLIWDILKKENNKGNKLMNSNWMNQNKI